MALIVFGVVLQQPPTREAPTSHHLFTYDTKSSSETPVFCCNSKKIKLTDLVCHTPQEFHHSIKRAFVASSLNVADLQ